MNRDETIIAWMPTAERLAKKQWHNLGGIVHILGIELEDLVQEGLVGLIEATDRKLTGAAVNFQKAIQWAIMRFLRSFPYFKRQDDGSVEIVRKVSLENAADLKATSREFTVVEAQLDLQVFVDQLPKTHQRVIHWFLRGLSGAAIGRLIGVSRQRVAQLADEAMLGLKLAVANG